MKHSWQRISRRSFLLGSAFASGAMTALLSKPQSVEAKAPAIITSDKLRPTIPCDNSHRQVERLWRIATILTN